MKKHFEANSEFEFKFESLFGNTICPANWKMTPQDFQVSELLNVDFTGEGEFLWVYVEKTNLNTETLAKYIAKALRINVDKLSWSGLKDKVSISKQWFSIHLGGKVILDKFQERLELAQEGQANWKILEYQVHQKKLRVGTHDFNRFEVNVQLNNQTGGALEVNTVPQEIIIERLAKIKASGFPNYFGSQRFGKKFSNLKTAQQLFDHKKKIPTRHLKGLALSASRSWLFNHQVSKRILSGQFDQAILGDVFVFESSSSLFTDIDDQINQRILDLEVHPTALLPGQGNDLSSADSLVLEYQVETLYPSWVRSLKDHKVKKDRRAIRALASDLTWEFNGSILTLKFQLKKGSYASSLLNCIFDLSHT